MVKKFNLPSRVRVGGTLLGPPAPVGSRLRVLANGAHDYARDEPLMHVEVVGHEGGAGGSIYTRRVTPGEDRAPVAPRTAPTGTLSARTRELMALSVMGRALLAREGRHHGEG